MTNQKLLAVVQLWLGIWTYGSTAQDCKGLRPYNGAPAVTNGFTATVISNKHSRPRGLIVDTEGNLLVVEKNKGITQLKLIDQGAGCVMAGERKTVVSNGGLTHGIALSADGSKLYASDIDKVYGWNYDAKSGKVTSQPTTLIKGMSGDLVSTHVTRTLLMSKKAPGVLLVSRGSSGNIDNAARTLRTGHSQIRAFDVTNISSSAIDYGTGGKVIGWGLRNSVGVAEHPLDGGLWSNENGSDNLRRDGKDIHENSPGEEINYHGTLVNNKFVGQGKNYGYPDCAATWTPAQMPRNSNLKVGVQFLLGTESGNKSDAACRNSYVAPRITLPSHWAPLDIAFNSQGTVAYMTSHGSWNKRNPDGFHLFAISYKDGQPVHPPESTTAALPVLRNPDNSKCPGGCFRPTGVTFDAKGRLYMASDATGEIFLIGRSDGRSTDSVTLETSYKG